MLGCSFLSAVQAYVHKRMSPPHRQDMAEGGLISVQSADLQRVLQPCTVSAKTKTCDQVDSYCGIPDLGFGHLLTSHKCLGV